MGAPSFEEFVKADMSTATLVTGGALNPEQLDYFVQLIQDQPTFLKDIQIYRMNSYETKLEHLEFTGPITQSAEELTEFTSDQNGAMTGTRTTLEAKKLRAQVKISDEMRMDNLLRNNLDNYVLQKLAHRFSLDLQNLCINGNTSLTEDPLLKRFNGVLKQANQLGIDMTGNPQTVTDDPFFNGFMVLPQRFRPFKPDLRFYCNSDVETAYNKWLSGRPTALGDIKITNGTQVTFWNGTQLFVVSDMPQGEYLLTSKNNIVMGVYQEIIPYKWVYPPGGYTLYGLWVRCDIKINDVSGAVRYQGLNPAANLTTT